MSNPNVARCADQMRRYSQHAAYHPDVSVHPSFRNSYRHVALHLTLSPSSLPVSRIIIHLDACFDMTPHDGYVPAHASRQDPAPCSSHLNDRHSASPENARLRATAVALLPLAGAVLVCSPRPADVFTLFITLCDTPWSSLEWKRQDAQFT